MTKKKNSPGRRTFTVECTGDVVAGDTVLFVEWVWSGTVKQPVHLGHRWIAARVLGDSYGAQKQQHTFTLQVLWSEGCQPLGPGATIRRKGRNRYKRGTKRLPWDDERQRQAAADEKHARGSLARKWKEMRRKGESPPAADVRRLASPARTPVNSVQEALPLQAAAAHRPDLCGSGPRVRTRTPQPG